MNSNEYEFGGLLEKQRQQRKAHCHGWKIGLSLSVDNTCLPLDASTIIRLQN
jgi:hypothetical protein